MKNKLIGVGVIIGIMVVIIASRYQFGNGKNDVKSEPVKNLSGKKITVLTNHPHKRSADDLAKWFHEETGTVVENIVVNYDEMLAYTLTDAASSSPKLDIIMFWYVHIGALVEKQALVDLTDFIADNQDILKPDDFIPSLYDPYTGYNGRRWALPYDGDTHVLFYRKSLLEKYGLNPPETWDDYLKAAKTITENEKQNGIYGTAIMAPPIPMIIISSFMNRLGCYGGSMLDSTGKPVINSPEAVMALSALIEHAAYALPTPLETDWEVSRDAFLSARVAMVEQWTDIGVMAQDSAQSIIQGDWGMVQMPKGSGPNARHAPALNSGFSLGISSKTKDLETAKSYLLFASRPDITLRLNLINGGIDPVRVSVLTSEEYRKFAPQQSIAAQAAIKGAAAWMTIPQAPQLLEILTTRIIMAIEGRTSPENALGETQAEWVKLLSNNPQQ